MLNRSAEPPPLPPPASRQGPLAQSSACGCSAGAVTDAVAHRGIGNLALQ